MSFVRFRRQLILVLLVLAAASHRAVAAEPLVDVTWVKANLDNPSVVFLDVRSPDAYKQGHVPGAVFTDYAKDGWRVEINKVPGMLPPDISKLTTLIGKLGIDNATHVVLIPPGATSSDMGNGTRIYWTFKVLGHDQVSILNGGYNAYVAEKQNKKPVNPVETQPVTPTPKTFTPHMRHEMIVSKEDVLAAVGAGTTVLVDARTADQYLGINRHGRSASAGTIPGALNLPQTWLTVNAGGTFRTPQELRRLYAIAGVPVDAPQVIFCNTAHWASVDWFVSSEILGNPQARIYDGSMTEWTQTGMPMEQKIRVN